MPPRRSSRFSQPDAGDELLQEALAQTAAVDAKKREKRRTARVERIRRAASELAQSTVAGEDDERDAEGEPDEEPVAGPSAQAQDGVDGVEQMDVDEAPVVNPEVTQVNLDVDQVDNTQVEDVLEGIDNVVLEGPVTSPVAAPVEHTPTPAPVVPAEADVSPPVNPDIAVVIPEASTSSQPHWETSSGAAEEAEDEFVPGSEDELDESDEELVAPKRASKAVRSKAGEIVEGIPFPLPDYPLPLSRKEFGERINGMLMTKWLCPILGLNKEKELVGVEAGYAVPLSLRHIVLLGLESVRDKVARNSDVQPSINRFNAAIRVFANHAWGMEDPRCEHCESGNRACIRAKRAKSLCVACNFLKKSCLSRAAVEKARPLGEKPEVIRQEMTTLRGDLSVLLENLEGSFERKESISGFGLKALVASVGKALDIVDRCAGPAPAASERTEDVFLALPMANGNEYVIALTSEAFAWRNEVEILSGADPESMVAIRHRWLERQGLQDEVYSCRVVRDSALDGLLVNKRKDKGKGKADGSPTKKARK